MNKISVDFSYKFFIQILTVCANFVTLGIVARTLNPINYGTFNYLTDFFRRLDKVIISGSMTAYFVKLSKNKQNGKLLSSYHLYLFLLLPIVILSLVILKLLGYTAIIFPNQSSDFIFLAAVLVLITLQSNGLSSTYDALGKTKIFELLRLLPLLIQVTGIVILFSFSALDLYNYFYLNIFAQIILFLIGFFIILNFKDQFDFSLTIRMRDFLNQMLEIFHFSNKLFLYSIIVFITAVSERWLLETYHGSFEQGIYSFAFKLSSIILIVGGSLSRLFLRESSERIARSSDLKIYLHKGLILNLFLGFFISFFLCIYSNEIIDVIGGKEYSESFIPLYLLSLSVGLNFSIAFLSSIYLGNENSSLHLKINLPLNIIFFIFCYLIITPNNWGSKLDGYNALPLKQLIMSFTSFIVVLTVVCRHLNLSLFLYIGHFLLIMFACCSAGYLSYYLSAFFGLSSFKHIVIGGLIYLPLTASYFIYLNNYAKLSFSLSNLVNYK